MNHWFHLTARLRYLLLIMLAIFATCSWLLHSIKSTARTEDGPPALSSPQPVPAALPGLPPLALLQSLQRPDIHIDKISFTGVQAHIQLSAEWQPFIELVQSWASTGEAPHQYQLRFERRLNARLQLQSGRFRAFPEKPLAIASLLSEPPAPVTVAATPAIDTCEFTPPTVQLLALWPARRYALVRLGERTLRVQSGDALAASGWEVAALTSSALHLRLIKSPAGCSEPPRHTLSSS
jgi:hypothetical protein